MFASFLNSLPETSVLRKVLREKLEEDRVGPRFFDFSCILLRISLENDILSQEICANNSFPWVLAETIRENLLENSEKIAKNCEKPRNFLVETAENDELLKEINGFSFQSAENCEKTAKTPKKVAVLEKTPIIIEEDEEKPAKIKEMRGLDDAQAQKSLNLCDSAEKFPGFLQKDSLISGIELRMRENMQEIKELKRKLKENSQKTLRNSENFIDLDEFEKKQEIFAEIDEFNEELLQNKEIYKKNGFFAEKVAEFHAPEEQKLGKSEEVVENTKETQRNLVFSPIMQAIIEENEAITLKSTINAVKTQQKQLSFKRKYSETRDLAEKDCETAGSCENLRKKTLQNPQIQENFCVNCFENSLNFKGNYYRLCERCFEELPVISQNFQIKLRDEPDKFEYFEKKQKIGERFQAKIPEIQRKSQKVGDFSTFSLRNPALIKVNSPKPQGNEEKNEVFESFAEKAQKCLEMKVSVEKLAYLLTLFDYNYEECLKQIENNRKAFANFVNYFKC